MLKEWLIKTFFKKRILLENILIELRNLHYHLDRMESFYMMVNKIREDEERIMIGDITIRKERGKENDLSK
jgi:hypothetical protein